MSRRLKPWSKRSTFAVVFLLVLMFWAGVATVGIVHHVAWMTQDPDPVMKLENGLISKRLQSTNNLSQLGRAIQIHHDIDGTFPAGAIFAADGRPLHGWQTLILPNLDLAALSRRIDRSRPWNDPVNAAAIQTPIREYLNPAIQRNQKDHELGDAMSHYSSNGWVIGGDRGKKFAEITDGLSQTLLIGEINDRIRPWGEPINWRDPAKGLNRVPGGFGSPFPGRCHFVFADGSARSLSDKIDPDVLRRLAHPDDGESLVDEDWSD